MFIILQFCLAWMEFNALWKNQSYFLPLLFSVAIRVDPRQTGWALDADKRGS
jgi:hypothetical protein